MSNEEFIRHIDSRLEQLSIDYKNVTKAITDLDKDRNSLVSRGIEIRGAMDEFNALKAEILSSASLDGTKTEEVSQEKNEESK